MECWKCIKQLTPLVAENFIRFCFCLWLQNQTRTTFFFNSNFFAMIAIFSDVGLGYRVKAKQNVWLTTCEIAKNCIIVLTCRWKYASSDRFSGAAIEVRFRFFSSSPDSFIFLWYSASASSSQVVRIGFNATMLLWLNVSDSNLDNKHNCWLTYTLIYILSSPLDKISFAGIYRPIWPSVTVYLSGNWLFLFNANLNSARGYSNLFYARIEAGVREI